MKKFIGYFDYLGFKDFIRNNDYETQRGIMFSLLKNIERSLALGKYTEEEEGNRADLKNSKIRCINFSDTVVFWTNDDTYDSLKELIEVTHVFNREANLDFFPVRGAIYYGEIEHLDYREPNEVGGIYNVNSIYSKGVVEACQKANQQDWAGTVIDQSIIEFLNEKNISHDDHLKKYAKKYKIPYKKGFHKIEEEYAYILPPVNLNDIAFKKCAENISKNFARHKKGVTLPSVKRKLRNTINFLKSFKKQANKMI